MSIHMTKTWFDGEKIITQEIPEEKIYLQGEEHMTCPDCERNRYRAALWRAEAYKQAGHDVIERPWVGLTDEEIERACAPLGAAMLSFTAVARAIEAKLKEKNGG